METAINETVNWLRAEVIKQFGEADTVRIDLAEFCNMAKTRGLAKGVMAIHEVSAYLKAEGFKTTIDHFRAYVDITPA